MSVRPPDPVGRVDKVCVRLSPPMPLNWDEKPGLDGIEVKVNLFFRDSRKPLSVTVDGTLEFELYEGIGTKDSLAGREPFHKWSLSGPDLDVCRQRGPFGWGYSIRLAWGPNAPTTSSVTLVTRYRSRDGGSLAAVPMDIAMVPK